MLLIATCHTYCNIYHLENACMLEANFAGNTYQYYEDMKTFSVCSFKLVLAHLFA